MRTLMFVVVLAASVAAQSSAVTVGTASPKAGEVAYGALAGACRAPMPRRRSRSPSFAAHKPGKIVAFIAGSHGTEYASVVALTRLSREDRSASALRHGHRAAAAERRVVRADDRARQSRGQERHERRLSRATPPARRRSARSRSSPTRSSSPRTSSSTCTAATSTKICGRTATGRAPATPRRTRRPGRSCWRLAWITSSCATSMWRIRRARGVSAATRSRRARRR